MSRRSQIPPHGNERSESGPSAVPAPPGPKNKYLLKNGTDVANTLTQYAPEDHAVEEKTACPNSHAVR